MTRFELGSGLENLVHLHLAWLTLPFLFFAVWFAGISEGWTAGQVAAWVLIGIWQVGVALFLSLRWVRSIVIRDDGFVEVRSGLGTRVLAGSGFRSMTNPGMFTQSLGLLLRHDETRFRLPRNFPCLEELELELRTLNPDFQGRDWKGWSHNF